MSGWIKCSERFPEKESTVLIYVDGDVTQALYGKRWKEDKESHYWTPVWLEVHGCGCCGGDRPMPSHWMALPAPPEDV